jgi:hypothetical protein
MASPFQRRSRGKKQVRSVAEISPSFLNCPLDTVLYMFYGAGMDWTLAIERNRESLLRIVLALFAMIGLREGGTVERLSWPVYRAVLRGLRPAEAAVRRLIIVAARDVVVKPSPVRPAAKGLSRKGRRGRGSFQLFDPRQRFDGNNGRRYTGVQRAEPRIHFIEFDPRSPLFRQPPPGAAAPVRAPQDTVNAASLCRRLAAIKHALEDLAAQARRYARWRARPLEKRRPKLASALRPGPPPGHRKRPSHAVDAILSECHWLARSVPQPDTS